jgi:predicted small secreted protein
MATRVIIAVLALVGTLLLSACANTVRGVGTDVKTNVTQTGKAIKHVAQ